MFSHRTHGIHRISSATFRQRNIRTYFYFHTESTEHTEFCFATLSIFCQLIKQKQIIVLHSKPCNPCNRVDKNLIRESLRRLRETIPPRMVLCIPCILCETKPPRRMALVNSCPFVAQKNTSRYAPIRGDFSVFTVDFCVEKFCHAELRRYLCTDIFRHKLIWEPISVPIFLPPLVIKIPTFGNKITKVGNKITKAWK